MIAFNSFITSHIESFSLNLSSGKSKLKVVGFNLKTFLRNPKLQLNQFHLILKAKLLSVLSLFLKSIMSQTFLSSFKKNQ